MYTRISFPSSTNSIGFFNEDDDLSTINSIAFVNDDGDVDVATVEK